MIRLIVGLGNPGQEYEKTRHNFGWRVVEALAVEKGIGWKSWKGNQLAEFRIQNSEFRINLLKSGTFMNLSGEAVGQFLRYHPCSAEEILVVHDELDLPLGTIQFKMGGSAGGHHGVESIIDHLGGPNFWRLRLGIGRPVMEIRNPTRLDRLIEPRRKSEIRNNETVTDYVLTPFRPEELPLASKVVDEAVRLLVELVENEPVARSIRIEQ